MSSSSVLREIPCWFSCYTAKHGGAAGGNMVVVFLVQGRADVSGVAKQVNQAYYVDRREV